MKYRVVKITKNIEGYPECKKDTEQFPDMVKYVADEMDLFIVDETGKFWPASEFFHIEDIEEFEISQKYTWKKCGCGKAHLYPQKWIDEIPVCPHCDSSELEDCSAVDAANLRKSNEH